MTRAPGGRYLARMRRLLLLALMCGGACSKAGKPEDRPQLADKDAARGVPDWTGPRCSTEAAPRPDRDPSPMCWVPPGEFMMGAPPERDGGDDGPQRRVRITRGFHIDQYEVTAAQFARFLTEVGDRCFEGAQERPCAGLTARPSPFKSPEPPYVIVPGKEDLPIYAATLWGAVGYCQWAGKELPSEAQWEFAAGHDPATGRDGLYPWGDTWEDGIANCSESAKACRDGHRLETAVGSFPRDVTAIGAFDMGGNAYEWVRDCYQRRYPACDGVCVDPVVLTGCETVCRVMNQPCDPVPGAVLRGGGTSTQKAQMWTTNRDVTAIVHIGGHGVRCVSIAE